MKPRKNSGTKFNVKRMKFPFWLAITFPLVSYFPCNYGQVGCEVNRPEKKGEERWGERLACALLVGNPIPDISNKWIFLFDRR